VQVLVAARGVAVADLLLRTLGAGACVQSVLAGRLAAALLSQHPDLLVVDESSLGSVVALTACRDARRDHHALPILFVSAKSTTPDEVFALDSGADSYLGLPCAPELLLARLRALCRRVAPNPAESLRFDDLTLDAARRTVRRGERTVHLTSTEYALLSHFLRSPETVLTRDDLIDTVWGHDYSGSFAVLDVYVCYLRSKLEAAGEPRLIQTVRGAGYVLRKQSVAERQPMVASRLPLRRAARQSS
jgi:two-component system, OmpR family, response regulator MprA